ncbi:MAG: hypothetical protein NC430_12185 [bacterium]|nr:hypothetical protein [bacterium]
MENIVKGTRYDVGNDHRDYWYRSDNNQHYCHINRYQKALKETETSKKQPRPTKLLAAFLIYQ